MAVTAGQLITVRGVYETGAGPVAASETLYGGTMAFYASGYLADVVASGANQFAGIVRETYDNASGSAGDISAEYYTEGTFELVGSGFTQGTVGSPIYASDNYTVTTSASNTSFVGMCVGFVSSTKILVKIETAPSFDGTGA